MKGDKPMKKPEIKVAGIERLHQARKLVEAGNHAQAAAVIRAFCWSNSTLQAEGGEDWSTLALVAVRLASGVTAGAAQKLIGEVWGRVMPYLTPA